MSAAETEEEAPPPPKKSIFACLTNLPGVCVPQKGAEPNADEPTPKSNKSPTSVASKFAALSPTIENENKRSRPRRSTRRRDSGTSSDASTRTTAARSTATNLSICSIA